MENNCPRILVLSSCPLSMGPAIIAGQYYEALRRKGLSVDLMLKNPEPGRPEVLYVVEDGYDKKFLVRAKRRYHWIVEHVKTINPVNVFHYTKEIYPPVPASKVTSAIKKQYDLVLIIFWHGLLSFETVQAIYDKLHCQIQILGVDYFHMSGGCHFVGDCQRYKNGCGKCPGVYSDRDDDFTAWNVQYRKKVYERVKPIVYGNQYMLQRYKESYLLKDARIELSKGVIIDTDLFKPLNTDNIRNKYSIPQSIKHIIFFGCQSLNDEKKGMKYLISALKKLHIILGDNANQTLVIMAGRNQKSIIDEIPFTTMGLGFLPIEELPEIYSLATLFVCPSIDDAGPMMVNQSLCCGTPVVGFDMGAIKQFVKGKGTGICVPLKDSDILADAMAKVIEMDSNSYRAMSEEARNVSLEYFSYGSQAEMIMDCYFKYKQLS